MEALPKGDAGSRYSAVVEAKACGVAYTPKALADFVARQVVAGARFLPGKGPVRLLDPAVGRGELLLGALDNMDAGVRRRVKVFGFETDPEALQAARARIGKAFPSVPVRLFDGDFLEFALDTGESPARREFSGDPIQLCDLIIANPPYVRTQVMGAGRTRSLAHRFGLTGRVDLYHAFVLGMAKALKPEGVAGIIVSNRFMTTKSGASLRSRMLERFTIRHIWDLGDTKLFDAAVLPCVLLVEGGGANGPDRPLFTSIYETKDAADDAAAGPVEALSREGVVEVRDGRRFRVRHGTLNNGGAADGVWRAATDEIDAWLAAVENRAWGVFGDIGKIRVGVKTCADKVFIRSDWSNLPGRRPELLRPVATHHIGRRFKALASESPREILYPHETAEGRTRAVELKRFPAARAYLEAHRDILSKRKYVVEAGREWYEIWVPQDPGAWEMPKLVFRDISEKPVFWMDVDGSVVNGDCYWMAVGDDGNEDLLWLALAVANSTFIERFYDFRFHNKLYAGRRRFMTQYVENFPLPDPTGAVGREIIKTARSIHDRVPSRAEVPLENNLDKLVWDAFGLTAEKAFGQGQLKFPV